MNHRLLKETSPVEETWPVEENSPAPLPKGPDWRRSGAARPAPASLEPTSRRGFTLMELLTVIGIMVLLIGVLLPAVLKMRKSAQITTMKLNFQAIATALENYKSDFRDYPRNPFALTDTANTSRTDPTLAMALIGPGAANALSGYPNGDVDGADGPGFRSALAPIGALPLATSASVGATTISVTGNVPSSVSVVSLGGPGSLDVHMAVTSVVSGATSTINLANGLQNPYSASPPPGTTVGLLAPTGRVWGPYVQAEKFSIKYTKVGSDARPLPMMLDVWNNPIYYFPAYYTYSNHTGTVGVQVGPLLGSPATATQAVFWNGPLQSLPSVAGQTQTIQFKMGDRDLNNNIDGVETFNVSRPYFLLSAGPTGVLLDLSPFADAAARSNAVGKSNNVYSFDQ